jgi:Methyltransferase domain
MSEVYNASFFNQHVAGSLSSARTMLPILFRYYQPQSVVDVGCGLAPWLKAAMELGAGDILGIDGDYVDRGALLVPEANFRSADLRERIRIDRRFDLAISMEVVEHLPYSRSETFIEDLVSLSDVVLFSAALPYQGGTDHINEQWLEFWAILFQRHGYVPYDFLRRPCWSDRAVEFWYSQNAIVFCATERGEKTFPAEFLASGHPLSQPHPLTFLINMARYRPLAAEALDPEWQDYESVIRAYKRGDRTPPVLGVVGASDGAGAPLFPRSRMVITDAHAEIASRDAGIASRDAEIASRGAEIASRDAEIASRDAEIASRDAEIASRDAEIVSRDAEIVSRDAEIAGLTGELEAARAELAAMRRSLTWRFTEPVRRWAGRLRDLSADRRTVRLLRSSGLFDRDYYLAQNPDVAAARLDPVRHYVRCGAAEGRNPSRFFETLAYVENHPELNHTGMNPLLHYALHGSNRMPADREGGEDDH